MKGKILGFVESSGVITGDDGKRYKFSAADWKAPRAPRTGEEVDYEISAQGMAAEIYPLRSGLDFGDVGAKMKDALGGADLGDVGAKAKEIFQSGAGSPTGARALMLLKTRLAVPLALILLLVSVVFGYVRWEGEQLPFADTPRAGSYSVLGISSFAGATGSMLTTIKQQAGAELAPEKQQYDELMRQGDANDAQRVEDEMSRMEGTQTDAFMAGLTLDVMYLLYLIPLGCLLILFLEWQGKAAPLAGLVVGGLGVLAFVLAYAAKSFINGAIKDFTGSLMGPDASAVPFGAATGFGIWLFLIGGALLLLNALGIVRPTR